MRVVSWISYILINIFETFIRLLPVPTKTGIRVIGNPDQNSPVFLTCNYHLTVVRVKRALENIDCYLLVANSRGINVWCAVTGGHFTNHDVISILKTSGIEELVEHRKIVLPQLAAAGLEPRVIREKTGWNAIWGPIYAEDIPKFVEKEFVKDAPMGEIRFSTIERLEMGISWAFPISLLLMIPVLIFWKSEILYAFTLVWGLAIVMYLAFPFYEGLLKQNKEKSNRILPFLNKLLIIAGFWVLSNIQFILFYWMTATKTVYFVLRWEVISFLVCMILVADLKGSTPTFKSDTHQERLVKIRIDDEKCKGTGICVEVCPRNCYKVDEKQYKVRMIHKANCIQCGACIVQCPFDALSFAYNDGTIISPTTVRKYKLNLAGKRDEKHK